MDLISETDQASLPFVVSHSLKFTRVEDFSLSCFFLSFVFGFGFGLLLLLLLLLLLFCVWFFVCLFFWEMEHKLGGAEGTKDRTPSRLCAICTEHNMGLKLFHCETMTWAEIKSWFLTDWRVVRFLNHRTVLCEHRTQGKSNILVTKMVASLRII